MQDVPPPKSRGSARITSLYIGFVILIGSVFFTLFIHLLVPKIRQKLRGKILISQFISLLFFYVTYTCVLSIDHWTSDPEGKRKACLALLAAFHYTGLLSACLINMRGVCFYFVYINNQNMDSPSYRLKAAVVALGIPGKILLITNVAVKDYLLFTGGCFLAKWCMIAGLVAPVCILFLLNVLILVRVHFPSHRLKPDTHAQHKDIIKVRRIQLDVWITVCEFILLFLSLIFGYLFVFSSGDQTVKFMLVGYTSVYGLCIILLHCLVPFDTRKKMKEIFNMCRSIPLHFAIPLFPRGSIVDPRNRRMAPRPTNPHSQDLIIAEPDRESEDLEEVTHGEHIHPRPYGSKPLFDRVLSPRRRPNLEPPGSLVLVPVILQRSPVRIHLQDDRNSLHGSDLGFQPQIRLFNQCDNHPFARIQTNDKSIVLKTVDRTRDDDTSPSLSSDDEDFSSDKFKRNEETQMCESTFLNAHGVSIGAVQRPPLSPYIRPSRQKTIYKKRPVWRP